MNDACSFYFSFLSTANNADVNSLHTCTYVLVLVFLCGQNAFQNRKFPITINEYPSAPPLHLSIICKWLLKISSHLIILICIFLMSWELELHLIYLLIIWIWSSVNWLGKSFLVVKIAISNKFVRVICIYSLPVICKEKNFKSIICLLILFMKYLDHSYNFISGLLEVWYCL